MKTITSNVHLKYKKVIIAKKKNNLKILKKSLTFQKIDNIIYINSKTKLKKLDR